MTRLFYFSALLCCLVIAACDKGEEPNPFDNVRTSQDTVRFELVDPEPNSIGGLYADIFKPTCANVGCHDGSFEPDFRTLESAYNTLVFQVPIKNDGNHPYRVVPGDPGRSVLMARLTGAVTPLMPFQLEPDSDWGSRSNEYIARIRAWIEAGAPDVNGVTPVQGHPTARIAGVQAAYNGNWLSRRGATGPLLIDSTMERVDLYFAFSHAEMNPALFTHNRIAFAPEVNAFGQAEVSGMEVLATPLQERGFYGSIVPYTHHIQVEPAKLMDGSGQKTYFRVSVKDQHNPVTEIPNDNGMFYIKQYLSLEWVD